MSLLSNQPATPPPQAARVLGNPPLIKPRLINPAGDPSFGALTSVPPFIFRNVTARVFSLRANMAVLRGFCDAYLNMDIPPSIVHYAPALPYVYLMVLNYGSMSGSSVEAQNLGWVSQCEVTFTVVLQRWHEENGSLVFDDWATVSPFIYVDDPTSLANGREIYGWNKVLGKIDSAVPLWIKDPRAAERQFDLSVVDFAATYAGENDEKQVLLQVDADPPPALLQFPPNPFDPWSPVWVAPNAVSNADSLLGSVADTLLALRLRGFEAHRSLDGLVAMRRMAHQKLKGMFPDWLPSGKEPRDEKALHAAVEGLPTLFLDSVTLKQFRNPEDPSLACYQALVNSSMGVDRVNRAGLLGDYNLLRGDTSGGYRIRLHKLDSQPIIQTLGLLVDSWSDAGGGGDTPGAVATIKPVLPYWLDLDLYYGRGNLICSRAYGGANDEVVDWREEGINTLVPSQEPVRSSRPYYNNALGAATQPIAGPFHFPDMTVQVYPLLADRGKLKEALDSYLNDPLSTMISPSGVEQKGWRFEPFGSFVYMMVSVYGEEFGQMWSGNNNIGGFFDREVTFCVPVKWYDENDELITVAVVEPFTFSNNGRAVATDREVDGFNTIRATIDSPRDVWLDAGGPIARRRLLEMSIEVIPALNLGQKAQQRPLMEIDELDALPPEDADQWRDVAAGWGYDVISDLKRRTFFADTQAKEVIAGKALALELLAYQAPLNRIILKQYRDGEQLTRACYQSIVQASTTITSVYEARELSPKMHIRLHQQPGNLIGQALGLKVKQQESVGGEVIDVLHPVRPFWMRIGAREELATVACYRSEEGPWKIVHPWFEPAAATAPSPAPMVAPSPLEDDRPPPAPRPLAGQKPYFKQDGAARVGAWLASVPGDGASAAQAYAAPGASDESDWPDPPAYDHGPTKGAAAAAPAASLDLPPRPRGDTLTVFANSGEVSAWLDVRLEGEKAGANLHLDMRNTAQDWLRRAIINELAWMRVSVDGCIDDLQARHGEDAELSLLLDCPIAPSALMTMAEQLSTTQLSALRDRAARLLKSACDVGLSKDPRALSSYEREFHRNLQTISRHFQAFFDASTEGIRETGLAWSWEDFLDGMITGRVLRDSIDHFRALPHKSKHAFLMTLPKAAYPLLLESGKFIKGPQYSFDTTFQSYDDVPFAKIAGVRDNTQRVSILADILERGLLDWMSPSRWRRYSYPEAQRAIAALDDVQLVIDNILSSEWENRSVHARFLNPKAGRQPDEAMELERQLEPLASLQGLQRWIDPLTGQASDLWVVPIPGGSDSIHPAADPMQQQFVEPPSLSSGHAETPAESGGPRDAEGAAAGATPPPAAPPG